MKPHNFKNAYSRALRALMQSNTITKKTMQQIKKMFDQRMAQPFSIIRENKSTAKITLDNQKEINSRNNMAGGLFEGLAESIEALGLNKDIYEKVMEAMKPPLQEMIWQSISHVKELSTDGKDQANKKTNASLEFTMNKVLGKTSTAHTFGQQQQMFQTSTDISDFAKRLNRITGLVKRANKKGPKVARTLRSTDDRIYCYKKNVEGSVTCHEFILGDKLSIEGKEELLQFLTLNRIDVYQIHDWKDQGTGKETTRIKTHPEQTLVNAVNESEGSIHGAVHMVKDSELKETFHFASSLLDDVKSFFNMGS